MYNNRVFLLPCERESCAGDEKDDNGQLKGDASLTRNGGKAMK